MVVIRKLRHLFALILCGSCALSSLAAEEGKVASLYSREGRVEGRFQNVGPDWVDAKKGAEFLYNDAIKVGEQARAGILFNDGMLVRLGSKAFLEFIPKGKARKRQISLKSGKGYFFNRKPGSRPVIKTPVVSAAIRGTEFAIEVTEETTKIVVVEGQVLASNEFGEVLANKGEQVTTKKGAAPVKEVLVDIENKIQWALYYPAVTAYDDIFSPTLNADERGMVQEAREGVVPQSCTVEASDDRRRRVCAVVYLEAGKLEEALSLLKPSSSMADGVLAASIYLGLGQADQAETALRKTPQRLGDEKQLHAVAQAQKAIIALAKGDAKSASSFVNTALQYAPGSATGALANSYVAQASANVEAAHEILARAVEQHPENAMLLARFAELELGLGAVRSAEDVVARALELDSNLSYAHMVQGYIFLIQHEQEDAQKSFMEALERDSTLSFAELGMGLASVGTEDYAAGREHIEKAVHLAPRNASFRSYLGKLFFEEDNYEKAYPEYDLAIELDEEDPTPYLYRAFINLAENDPVAALADVQRSISRNDNRAVFRSRMLLDKDEAMRSASLARVYNDLGFFEAGRVEAIKAISRDYSNYSAHRLLASSYGRDPFTARARIIEENLGDLLAPPTLNLFFGNGEQTSVGEYTALFDKSEQRTEVAIDTFTEQDFLSGRMTHAGKQDNLGYAVIVEDQNINGSKGGRFDQRFRANTVVKWEPSYGNQLTFNGEYNYDGQDTSDDLEAVFVSDVSRHAAFGRVGYSGQLSPDLTMLNSTMYQYQSERAGSFRDESDVSLFIDNALPTADGADSFSDFTVDTLLDRDFVNRYSKLRTELQFIYTPEHFTIIGGGSVDRTRYRGRDNTLFLDTTSFPELLISNDSSVPDSFTVSPFFGNNFRGRSYVAESYHEYRAYLYNTAHLTEWLDLVGGVNFVQQDVQFSIDPPFLPGTSGEDRGWNPKVGLVATPFENMLLRLAYFEERVNSQATASERLEPILVGGINQVVSGAVPSSNPIETFAAAIDMKFDGTTYLGTEYQRIKNDTINSTTNYAVDIAFDTPASIEFGGERAPVLVRSADLDIITSYWYQVWSDWFVSSFRHAYEDSESFTIIDGSVGGNKTHILSCFFKQFWPQQFFSRFGGTYRHQETQGSGILGSGEIASSSFWIFSVGVGYRFPKRRGGIELQVENIFDESFDSFRGLSLGRDPLSDTALRVVGSFNF